METISDLDRLIKDMDPALSGRKYYMATVDESALMALASSLEYVLDVFREDEGLSVVFEEDAMDAVQELAGGKIAGPFALITLRVRSDLMAVGFLARLAAALAEEGISVNAFSAYHHDHLLVPLERKDDAMRALARLRSG
jgi:hypothetical protein